MLRRSLKNHISLKEIMVTGHNLADNRKKVENTVTEEDREGE